MPYSRRTFLAATTASAAIASSRAFAAEAKRPTKAELDQILAQPVLNTQFLKGPVIVSSVELLKSGNTQEFVFTARNGTLSRIIDDFEKVDPAKPTRQYSYQFGNPIQTGKLTVDLREVALVQMDDL